MKFLGSTGITKLIDLIASRFAVIGHNHDGTYAASSHGNHVPTTETANNARFLRNDNTWQTLTPANIGASASDHTHNYAGSSSAGGSATSVVRQLGTADSARHVWFSDGNDGSTGTGKCCYHDGIKYNPATSNLTITKINGVAVGSSPKFTDTVYTHPNTVTAGTVGTSSATSGSTLAVPYVTYNANGHITATGTHTHTITGFAASSHTHSYLPLSGGTLTGAVYSSAHFMGPLEVKWDGWMSGSVVNTIVYRVTLAGDAAIHAEVFVGSGSPLAADFVLTCFNKSINSFYIYGDYANQIGSRFRAHKDSNNVFTLYYTNCAYDKTFVHVKGIGNLSTLDRSVVGTTVSSLPSETVTPTNVARSTFSLTSHTHSYAGSSSAGGAATSAAKLNTNAGSATQPVYFSNGVPVATTYTIATSVPSGAKFTDTVYTHPTTVTAGTVGTSSATSGSTLAVPYVTYNANGHITATGTHTHTITGFATSSHTHNYAGSSSAGGAANSVLRATFGDSSNGEHNANNIASNGMWYYTSNGPATSLGASTNDGALYSQAYSTSWAGQIAQDYRNGRLFVRGKNNGTWQSWQRIPWYSEVALSGHTHSYASTSVATQSANGLMSAADKKKLDGIAAGAMASGISASSNAANGYIKFSNGLIIQWGVVTAPTTETTYSLTFPVSFASTCYSVNVSADLSTHGSTVTYAYANIHPQVYSVSKTGATLYSQHSQDASGQASRTYWMATGV